MDTRLFYPEQGEDVSQARAVCAICPVSRQCGDYATRNHERYGLWGGSSGRQRRQNLHVDLTVVDTLRRHAGRETEVA